jgi:hypothetical protein
MKWGTMTHHDCVISVYQKNAEAFLSARPHCTMTPLHLVKCGYVMGLLPTVLMTTGGRYEPLTCCPGRQSLGGQLLKAATLKLNCALAAIS